MAPKRSWIALLGIACMTLASVAQAGEAQPAKRGQRNATPQEVKAKAEIARGRYFAIVGGCNDCHTAGYAPSGGTVPEAQWLLGDGVVGFRGPWGTTYAPNLRKVVASMSEGEFVQYVRNLKARPPMPWFTLNQWREADLRALFRYIQQLGPPGEAVTAFVPPDQAPKGPVIQWPSPPPK